jgi:hypothetical protein
MKSRWLLLCAAAAVLMTIHISATWPQDAATAASAVSTPVATFHQNTPPAAGDGSVSVKHLASDFEFWLTVIILAFGSLIIVIEYLILRRMPQAKPDDALRLFAITFIIVGTLVFVAAGFDSSQIAPAAGLFGTIAGYLLGKEAGRSKDGDQRGDDKAAQQEQRSGS